MKLLFQSYTFWPSTGGIESSALLLLRELTKTGVETRVHTACPLEGAAELADYYVVRRPSVQQVREDGRWADVIYQHNPSLRLGLPLVLLRKPRVVSIRTWLHRAGGQRSRLVGWVKAAWVCQQRVIANSRPTAAHLPCRATVIANSYDNESFFLPNDQPDRRGMIFVGRLVSSKGCHTAIKAVELLNGLGTPLHLTIVGSGPEEARLRAQASGLGIEDQVRFAGRQPPHVVGQLLRQHKYHVIPSVWEEPFGIVALEGIACGCLPIGTNRGGLVDAIGRCGPVFEAEDARGLAEQIAALEASKELSDAYYQNHTAHLNAHSPQAWAQSYLAVFQESMAGPIGKHFFGSSRL
jgi:glycogen synthase